MSSHLSPDNGDKCELIVGAGLLRAAAVAIAAGLIGVAGEDWPAGQEGA